MDAGIVTFITVENKDEMFSELSRKDRRMLSRASNAILNELGRRRNEKNMPEQEPEDADARGYISEKAYSCLNAVFGAVQTEIIININIFQRYISKYHIQESDLSRLFRCPFCSVILSVILRRHSAFSRSIKADLFSEGVRPDLINDLSEARFRTDTGIIPDETDDLFRDGNGFFLRKPFCDRIRDPGIA